PYRRSQFALSVQENREVIVGQCVRRCQADGLAVLVDGCVRLVLVIEGDGKVEMSFGEAGV
ncbi:MAG TPA: hypothetical protein VMO17_16260, partial [Terriglobia bacterium]|nr:hypothetical protein [Terriglobia bacterium]